MQSLPIEELAMVLFMMLVKMLEIAQPAIEKLHGNDRFLHAQTGLILAAYLHNGGNLIDSQKWLDVLGDEIFNTKKELH